MSTLSKKTVTFTIRYFIATLGIIVFAIIALYFKLNLYFLTSSFLEGIPIIISIIGIGLIFLLRHLKAEKDISEENYMLCITLSSTGVFAPWIFIFILMTMLH